MKRENIKNKLIVILGGLLFISIVTSVSYISWINLKFDKRIKEFNRYSEIDFNLINKQADVSDQYYNTVQICNQILLDNIEKKLSNDVLTKKIVNYTNQLKETNKSYDELLLLKTQRSEEIAKFKYVNIYKN